MLELFNKNIVPQWEDIRAFSASSVLALATLLAIGLSVCWKRMLGRGRSEGWIVRGDCAGSACLRRGDWDSHVLEARLV